MATVIKNPTEASAPAPPPPNLLLASLVGAVYVALGLGAVFFGIPYVWKQTVGGWVAAHLGGFFDPTGMALLIIAAGVGLLYLGKILADRAGTPPGLRAGVFTIVGGALLLFLVTVWVGRLLQSYVIKDPASGLGLGVTLAVGVALLAGVVRWALRGGLDHFLVSFEQQGWFNARTYKASQGRLVRRLTMLGLLLVIGSGVWALYDHRTLSGDWVVRLPFTQGLSKPGEWVSVMLLPDIRYTAPLLLVALGAWFSWRAVNYPVFADFLIATEAELNKVSWVSRKRLIQDTIVVLVTLALFTLFLLVIDAVWGWALSRETIGGIVPKGQTKPAKEVRETSW